MFYLIDKPSGCTSFEVLRNLRKVLWIKKIWHTGTLDPLATGCLLVATENSTKLIPLLEWATKRYRATVRIDGSTETLDLGSDVEQMEYYEKKLREGTSTEGLRQFLLKQTSQIPPKYSALLLGGKRAYELAREGKDFTLAERAIEIYEVIIHEIRLPSIDIEILVSSGTYVRSLAPSIGAYFGTDTWYITSLDRTEILPLTGVILTKHEAQDLSHFEIQKTISYDDLFPDIGKIELSQTEYTDIQNGVYISYPDLREGKAYFLFFAGKLCSLTKAMGGKLLIERNNL